MNKHISTAAAAVALLSAIGFASAQSTMDPAVPPATAASGGGDGLAHPADPAVTPTTDTSMTQPDATMTTERAPQADRN